MLLLLALLLVLVSTPAAPAPIPPATARALPTNVPVFVSGTNGYATYRIPALITLPNGDFLAFCEGRVQGAGDFGDIDIVLKRSTDGGHTWSATLVVADHDSLQAGNPAPVLDMSDQRYPKGRLFLFYSSGNAPEPQIRQGNGYKQVWYKTSVDGGRTWSTSVDITTQVHRQRKPHVNAFWNFNDDWRYYATTPGHAMQFTTGSHRGRMYVGAGHSFGAPQPNGNDYRAHGFYTDDHGVSFTLSESVPFAGGNENTATELSGGRLMMNIRNQSGTPRARIVAISNNGGETWDTTFIDADLPDPVNQGSIVTIGTHRGRNRLAFVNAASTTRRDSLTLRISDDDGTTWTRTLLLAASPSGYTGAFSAYSDVTPMRKDHVGVLYERDNYSSIVFTTVKWTTMH